MIEFIRELNKNYLSITGKQDEPCDYTMKMVENNSVEGLLPVRKSVVNNTTSYLYDISGCIPLEERYVKGEFAKDDILSIANSINGIIQAMDRYMLDINGVLFDTKYIFCGINNSSWKYVYNSELMSDARAGIKRVFEYILGHLDHRDSDAVILGYGLYKRVCRDEISLQKIFENLDEFTSKKETDTENGAQSVGYELSRKTYPSLSEEAVKEEHEKKVPNVKFLLIGSGLVTGLAVLSGLIWGIVTAAITALIGIAVLAVVFVIVLKGPTWDKIVTSEIRLPYETQNPQIKVYTQTGDVQHDENRYEMDVQTGGSHDTMEAATVVIGAQPLKCLRRVSKSGQTGDEYLIMEDSVSVGSGAAADIIIKDSGISRLHARITMEGEMVFIKDMNSTNGTWINDRRISVYELCPVKNGDVIRLAGSSFELIDTVS